MKSEIELDEELKCLNVLAASPELYETFVSLGGITSLLGLLTHENTDISLDVVALLNEMTDGDVLAESERATSILIDALAKNQALELLVQNINRLNEGSSDEDAKGVFNTLGIFENLIEARSEIAVALAEKTDLLEWLLVRASAREFDTNKMYASEILAILLQSDARIVKRFGDLKEVDALDRMLQILARYRRRDPESEEEKEFVENLFDSLCCMLNMRTHRNRFRLLEGFELIIRMLKAKSFSAHCALKVLRFALARAPESASRFVEVGGLKTFFSVFMGHGVRKQIKSYKIDRAEFDEHILAIGATLASTLEGVPLARFLKKFHEKEGQKVNRLCDVFSILHERVRRAKKEKRAFDAEEHYLALLDAGLFALQRSALIALVVVNLSSSSSKTMLVFERELKERGLSLGSVKDVAEDLLENLVVDEDADDSEATSDVRRERSLVTGLLANLRRHTTKSTMLPPPPRPASTSN